MFFGMDVSPLAIILVKNGPRGDRLLFKYPFAVDSDESALAKSSKRNPYSITSNESSVSISQKQPLSTTSNVSTGNLSNFSDKVMSHLFAVHKRLCGAKFELKVNDVRFVGHPVNLEENKDDIESFHDRERKKSGSSTILLFNIVFALKATISHDVVNCYYDLSRRLGITLACEEKRCQFLTLEAKMMLAAQDEALQQPESTQESSFQMILNKSLLAKHLKQVYEDLCNFGKVHLRLNKWLDISFCLPQKINQGVGTSKRISYEVLMKGLSNVKPYHSILLLVDRQELLQSLSPDVSPSLRRLLHVESPISPFYTLAADADLTLSHVMQLAGHLVYWGKGTIIYPVCNTNIYVLSSHAPTFRMCKLAEKFQEQFPGKSYHATLSEYSLPMSLQNKFSPFCQQDEQQQEKQIFFWLMKHSLLQQLHTYIYLSLPPIMKVRPSLCSSHPSSARGHLAPVAEVLSEKPLDEVQPEPTPSPKLEGKLQNSYDFRSPIHRLSDTVYSSNTKDIFTNMRDSFTLDDYSSSHELNSYESFNRKNFQMDEINASTMASLSGQRNVFQNLINVNRTPSESDFGSVCSDDRSLSPGLGTASDNTEEMIIHELSNYLTLEEKEMVLQADSSKNLEDLKLFARLCPYFRGEHHMEEIMYYANIRRSQLLEVLDKFRSILITSQRVDPSIAFISD